MSQEMNDAVVPEIILRIPGPWKRRQELEKRLPDGFRVEGERLLTPQGRPLELQTLPADREFPNIFRMACRRRSLKPGERRGLDSYAMNAAVVGPAGSMMAAQYMLEASASLIRAGGIGVFIDNSVLAHSGSDWLELAEHRSHPAAVFYAFVSLAKLGSEIVSHGMQVLGQRDGVVSQEKDLPSLEDFLRMSCADQPELDEGETFSDQQGRRFCLRGESDPGIFKNHPVNNPYGRWRLEPV